jgi:capsular polysaccharide biosynthesis protein
MSRHDSSDPLREASLTVARLLKLAWEWRVMFLSVSVLCAAAIITYAFVATPTYRVAVKMMPQQGENPASGLQSLLGQFGGVASLIGGVGAPVDEQEALAWLKTRSLAQSYIVQHNLMPVLFAHAWDPVKKRWREDLEHEPTMDDAWAFFDRGIRKVNQDTKTKMITFEITWRDRQVAAAWANGLVALANEELRQRALQHSDATLKSLEAQLEETETLELRQSIYRLMEVQVNRKVLAKSRPDYAFAVLDPAVVPDANRFASPRRFLLLLIAFPFGIFAGASAVIALQFLKSLRQSWRPAIPASTKPQLAP